MLKIPSIEELLKAGAHFGHKTSRWHPKMAPFIFGAKKGIHVIDLEKTKKAIGEALDYLKKTVAEGKILLLVGTKEQVKNRIKELAIENEIPFVTERWLGGTLTNFTVIRQLTRKYSDLVERKASGKFERYTKKERLMFEDEIERLEKKVGGLVKMPRIPDAIFIWDIRNEDTALKEARKKKVPVIAVCDTNANPEGVKFIIPANDDSTKTIKLIMDFVGEAVKEGKKQAGDKRKEIPSAEDLKEKNN